MDKIMRKVYNRLADFDGATILEICQCGISVSSAEQALDALVKRNWVKKKGSVYRTRSPRAMSVGEAVQEYMGVEQE